jgi:hypothetical protein
VVLKFALPRFVYFLFIFISFFILHSNCLLLSLFVFLIHFHFHFVFLSFLSYPSLPSSLAYPIRWHHHPSHTPRPCPPIPSRLTVPATKKDGVGALWYMGMIALAVAVAVV